MLFSSIPFLYYFLPCVLLVYFAAPKKLKNSVLLLASLFFYGWGEPKYLLLMLFSIMQGYVFGLLIEKSRERRSGKLCLAAGVGFLASTASNLVAAIRRKRRVLGIIRLMGFSGADIVCFPLMQTLFTSALGMGLAFALYAAVAGVINALFPLGAELGAVCRLSWAHVGGAAGVVLALSLLAALPPSLSCSRLSPSEVIRNE